MQKTKLHSKMLADCRITTFLEKFANPPYDKNGALQRKHFNKNDIVIDNKYDKNYIKYNILIKKENFTENRIMYLHKKINN